MLGLARLALNQASNHGTAEMGQTRKNSALERVSHVPRKQTLRAHFRRPHRFRLHVLISCAQDLQHLLGPRDRPRVGVGPVVKHAILGQARQVCFLDLHLPQAAGHTEVTDEGVEHFRCGLVRPPCAALAQATTASRGE